MSKKKGEQVLQVFEIFEILAPLFKTDSFKFASIQQEIDSSEQWHELLSKEGLIG